LPRVYACAVVLCVLVVPCGHSRRPVYDSDPPTSHGTRPGSFPEASNAEDAPWRLATVWVTTADL
jgi:hypothetical protein